MTIPPNQPVELGSLSPKSVQILVDVDTGDIFGNVSHILTNALW
jgi:hypothetical protein